jgi:nucleotide-binding universal stress UspA family protein
MSPVFEKIVAGTDGSDTAWLALAHAADLAERLDAELTVVSAHSAEDSDRGSAPLPQTEAGIASAALRDVESAYRSRVRLRTKAARGSAADVLIQLAQTEGYDLIVVGNRGLSGTSWLSPASIPGRVSHRSPVAVLIVDTVGRQEPGYRRILVGTDGSATAAKAVDAARALAEDLGAELALATASGTDESGRRTLEALGAAWPGVPTHVVSGDPVQALDDLAKSGGYDLLVVGNKGMGGPRRILGSVPAKLARRGSISLLIINTTG